MNLISTHVDIERLEQEILKVPQVNLGTISELSGEVCARTIFIPAGTVLTGAVHKLDSISIVYGDITVTTDNGTKRITGYHVLPSVAGTKRAGFAHADTYWTSCWHTKLTDLEAIEDEMTDDSARLQNRVLALQSTTFEALEK